jgi:UDP-N-acetylglucosamine 2-epimerase (non-hydrolysing)
VKDTDRARQRFSALAERYGLATRQFALVTLHRPSNVDERSSLANLVDLFDALKADVPRIVFPVHPRTRARLTEFELLARLEANPSVVLIDPVGYLDFLALQQAAGVVLTDSGGVQEETTVLGTPCLTLRENTERPITIDVGTNVMVGSARDRIEALTKEAMQGKWKRAAIPELWDGNAAERIVNVIMERLK